MYLYFLPFSFHSHLHLKYKKWYTTCHPWHLHRCVFEDINAPILVADAWRGIYILWFRHIFTCSFPMIHFSINILLSKILRLDETKLAHCSLKCCPTGPFPLALNRSCSLFFSSSIVLLFQKHLANFVITRQLSETWNKYSSSAYEKTWHFFASSDHCFLANDKRLFILARHQLWKL